MSFDQPRERPELRRIGDLATLRALTHPVRIALLELLALHGPTTATQAGERLGETPGNCSFHLRRLAAHGFVEEAGGGRGRARPWKVTQLGMQITGEAEDPATDVAAQALGQLIMDRQLARLQSWRLTRGGYPRAWRDAAIESQTLAWVTPEELLEINERMVDQLLSLKRERLADPSLRPPGALPIELLVYGYPIEPPGSDAE